MKDTEKIADFVAKSKDVTSYVKRTLLSGKCDNPTRLQTIYDLAKEVVDNIYEFGLSKLYNKWFDYFSKNYMGKWVKIKLDAPIDRGIGEVVDSVVMEVNGMGSAENGFCFCEKKGQPVYYIQSGTNDNFLAVYPVIRLHPGDVIEVNFDDGFLDRIQVVSLDYVQKLRNSKLCMELEDQIGEKKDD